MFPTIDADAVIGLAKHYDQKERPPKGTYWVMVNKEKIPETNDENEAYKKCPHEGVIISHNSTYVFGWLK